MKLDDIIPQYMMKLAYACVSMSVFESVNACVCVCVCVWMCLWVYGIIPLQHIKLAYVMKRYNLNCSLRLWKETLYWPQMAIMDWGCPILKGIRLLQVTASLLVRREQEALACFGSLRGHNWAIKSISSKKGEIEKKTRSFKNETPFKPWQGN